MISRITNRRAERIVGKYFRFMGAFKLWVLSLLSASRLGIQNWSYRSEKFGIMGQKSDSWSMLQESLHEDLRDVKFNKIS